jgi:hypothetical protein
MRAVATITTAFFLLSEIEFCKPVAGKLSVIGISRYSVSS